MFIFHDFYLTVYLQCLHIVLLLLSPFGVYTNEIQKSESNEIQHIQGPTDYTYDSWMEQYPDYGSENRIDENANDFRSVPEESQAQKQSYEKKLPESYDNKQNFWEQEKHTSSRLTDLPPEEYKVEKLNFKVLPNDPHKEKTFDDGHDRHLKTNFHPKANLSSIKPRHEYQGLKEGHMHKKHVSNVHLARNLGTITLSKGNETYKTHKKHVATKMHSGSKFMIKSKKKQINNEMPSSYKHKINYNYGKTNKNKLKKHENYLANKSKPTPTQKFEEEGKKDYNYYLQTLGSVKSNQDKIKHQPPIPKSRNENKYPQKMISTSKTLKLTHIHNDKHKKYGDKRYRESVTTKTVRHDFKEPTKGYQVPWDKNNNKQLRSADHIKNDREKLNEITKSHNRPEEHKGKNEHTQSYHVAKLTALNKHHKVTVSDKHEHRKKPEILSIKPRVTQGINYSDKKVVHHNKKRKKKLPDSYESIEMIDSSDDDSKVTAGATRSGSKGSKAKKDKSSKPSLIEKDVLKPFSIAAQLRCLRKKLDDYAIIEQEVIGKTVEYNDIVLWKIKEKPDFSDEGATAYFRSSKTKAKAKFADDPPEKKIILIVHGLTVMGWHDLDCLNKIKRFETLVGYYIENLDCYDIYLIPMANPDGVTKSLTTQPWNKNISPQNACPGVALDRNFDVEWNKNTSNSSSCRQYYPGPAPFSERETQAVRDLFKKYSHKMVAYLHVHAGSYDSTVFKGDAVLYPKGYSDDTSDDDKYIDLKGEVEEAMRNVSFNYVSVTVDTLYNWYGLTTGTSVDYATKVYGIPYAMELVMQLYEDDAEVKDEDKSVQNAALTEIWQVVIDVVFDSIYKHTIQLEES